MNAMFLKARLLPSEKLHFVCFKWKLFNSSSTNCFSQTSFWNTNYRRYNESTKPLSFCRKTFWKTRDVCNHLQLAFFFIKQGCIYTFENKVTFLKFDCSSSTYCNCTWLPNNCLVLLPIHFEITITEDTINQPNHYLFVEQPFWKTRDVYKHLPFPFLIKQGCIYTFENKVTFLEFYCSSSAYCNCTWFPNDYLVLLPKNYMNNHFI